MWIVWPESIQCKVNPIIAVNGIASPTIAQALANRADDEKPLKFSRVSAQKVAIIIAVSNAGDLVNSGATVYTNVPAINDRVVGYQTKVLTHCSQMARKPI